MSVRYGVIAVGMIVLILAIGCGKAEPVVVVVTATPTDTPVPPTPTYTPTPMPIPASLQYKGKRSDSLPEAILLEPMNYRQQTANNCGPASTAIVLGYYDLWITQQEINEHVPPGCLSCDIVNYLPRHQLMARAYTSPPTLDPARQLLANGIPIIAKQTLTPDINALHFRVIRGYDNTFGAFISDDPLQGSSMTIAYDTFAELSDPGILIPVYPPEKDPLVRYLMDDLGMSEHTCRQTGPEPY
ncbi:MAG: hypothetical protein DRJ03_14705 [Chloroflexi bacterium]|nr:MAG: hypothetical protein B6I35_13675 [Anaerolineaceae bacterium 4572_32.2]RLC78371.1 MAG: hypothetical protein DRI81_06855 [Chloroflexota bacterium]RLC84278.1 MAG: hypothetical protein DRJ03_14705 [Chloroflexota bacterium]HEY71783.1 hypothetical protein [Thermoflexia bacterium]